ncbi:MAG: glycosyltransferase family 2 protein [Anaerolineales bacterium]|nr:glycosyltransferase family 2 protein [Anaerolineales bacterium]
MRTGKNPSKTGIPAYTPNEIGIALLVYIPFLEGYFRHSLEILKYQIASLYKSTEKQFDLLVFDNGSCSEVIDALNNLHDQHYIEWLVLSRHNLGKVGAWNWIFGSMPNDLICYADSDVLFRRGWLESSLGILKAFPKAGMVSAQPTFHDVLDGKGVAHLSLNEEQDFRFSEYKPKNEIVEEYCLGIGADIELAASFHNMTLDCITALRDNTSAVVGATHMQFIIPREVARCLTPLPVSKGLHRAETTSLDRKIDKLGYLHLSTQENYVMHMGNTLNEYLLTEVQELDGRLGSASTPEIVVLSKKFTLFRLILRLAEFPRINQFLLNVYDFLYRVLYVEKQQDIR